MEEESSYYNVDDKIENATGHIKDEVEIIKDHNIKAHNKREKLKKKFDEETKRYSEEMRKKESEEKRNKILNTVLSVFKPITWINWIQYFEEFFYVLLIDVSLIGLLFSVIALFYIILSFKIESIFEILCKVGGIIILFTLSMIIQSNLVSNQKGK